MANVREVNIQAYNKAIVAVILAVVGLANLIWGLPLVNQDAVTALVSLVTPVLVYLIPNR